MCLRNEKPITRNIPRTGYQVMRRNTSGEYVSLLTQALTLEPTYTIGTWTDAKLFRSRTRNHTDKIGYHFFRQKRTATRLRDCMEAIGKDDIVVVRIEVTDVMATGSSTIYCGCNVHCCQAYRALKRRIIEEVS